MKLIDAPRAFRLVKNKRSLPDFGILLQALHNVHSNVQIERVFGCLWKDNTSLSSTQRKQTTMQQDGSGELPGTAGKSTPPAPALKGRRARREPAAASYISPAERQSASRWRNKKRAGKWRYRRLHSAPAGPQ